MTAAAFPMVSAPMASHTRLRLTRRGRTVLGVVVLAPVLAASIAFGLNAAPAAAGDSAESVQLTYVTVGSGESLWAVAESVAPGHDPRDVITDIIKLNGLSSANVPAGSRIAIPNY